MPRTSDPTDRLRLVQWLSPAFPIGAFAYSQGLESAIAAGDLRRAADVEGWITAVLRHGSGRSDAILLAQHTRHRNGVHTVLAGFVETLQALPLEEEERQRYLGLMAQPAGNRAAHHRAQR